MSEQAYWPNSKGLKKTIRGHEIYLGKAWDLKHGYGWHSQVFCNDTLAMGYAFHKTNKFTAIKKAMIEMIKVKTIRQNQYLKAY